MKKIWLIPLLAAIRITSAAAYDITITADKQVEIYQNEQKAVAIGNAVAVKPGMTVKGEILTAWFSKSNQGKTSITDMEAR